MHKFLTVVVFCLIIFGASQAMPHDDPHALVKREAEPTWWHSKWSRYGTQEESRHESQDESSFYDDDDEGTIDFFDELDEFDRYPDGYDY